MPAMIINSTAIPIIFLCSTSVGFLFGGINFSSNVSSLVLAFSILSSTSSLFGLFSLFLIFNFSKPFSTPFVAAFAFTTSLAAFSSTIPEFLILSSASFSFTSSLDGCFPISFSEATSPVALLLSDALSIVTLSSLSSLNGFCFLSCLSFTILSFRATFLVALLCLNVLSIITTSSSS